MREKTLLIIGMVTLAVLLATPTISSAGGTMELRFNSMYSPKHPINVHAFGPWIKEVEKRTEGRVKVTLFPSSALATVKEAYDAAMSGVCDIAVSCPTYAPDRFPLSTVIDLPMLGHTKAETNALTMWELHEKFPQLRAEYTDVKLLWFYANPSFQLHFTKRPVHKLEELKGMVVASGSAMGLKILKSLGASPENLPMVDVYLALQKGVVEGCLLPYAPMKPQKIADLIHYHTDADLMCASFYVVMNLEKWKGISPGDQKAIGEIIGRYGARLCGSVFDKYQTSDVEWMAKKGDKFYTLPPEERARWVDCVMPLRDDWIRKMEGRGLPGKEIKGEAERLIDKYKK